MNPTGKLFFDNLGPIDIYVETINQNGTETRFECVDVSRKSFARRMIEKECGTTSNQSIYFKNGTGIAFASTCNPNGIKEVIFNPPATIVFWNDGTKTVVKCQNDEVFDTEKGLAMAISKKYFGNKGSYCNQIKKWTEKYEDEQKANESMLAKKWRRAQEVMQKLRDVGDFYRINRAYERLTNTLHSKRPRKDELTAAMEEAIRYLGEVLDD